MLFPPNTNEIQYDEKWNFNGKKEKNCDPDDPNDENKGDNWDHVGLDPEHRLVLKVVPGKRTPENTHILVNDTKQRLNGRTPRLITTDKYPPYKDAILEAFGTTVTPPSTGERGRPRKPYLAPPPGLTYAMVKKTLKKGHISKVETLIVFGNEGTAGEALKESKVSKKINTSFIERQNGTDRNRNSRKARKTLCFSKDKTFHDAMTYFIMYSYNFCWPVRTLRIQTEWGERSVPRTPAMAAGLADHIWTIHEWASFPVVQLN